MGGRDRFPGPGAPGDGGVTAPSGTAPATAAAPRGPRWYWRKSAVVPAVVVVVLAITVLTDLPQHTSRSAEISGDRTVMSQINGDVGPCSYALGETFTIYAGLTAHSLTRSELGQAPGLLRDDQVACSFTDDSVYQLSTIEVPGSSAGKDLGQLVSTVTLWATSDALSAIEQVQTLDTHPTDSRALAQLRNDERLLASDRAQAEAELNAADKVLRTRLPAIQLAQAPAPASPAA
jgi:hypothetical protein